MPNTDRPPRPVVQELEEPHWFEAVADHLGAAYLRYSFTKGTPQEIDFLVDALGLEPGARILDVGCGPGRHSLDLAARGFEVVGVDISQRFVTLAASAAATANLSATFLRHDARRMDFSHEFDAAISLCQGAFGLQGRTGIADWTTLDEDGVVLERTAAALRSGGRMALSAFSAYFQVRFLEDSDSFDAAGGVNHESTQVRDERGKAISQDLWTTCFTPRELKLLAEHAGLRVSGIWSVEPGRYARRRPEVGLPEFLLIATKE